MGSLEFLDLKSFPRLFYPSLVQCIFEFSVYWKQRINVKLVHKKYLVLCTEKAITSKLSLKQKKPKSIYSNTEPPTVSFCVVCYGNYQFLNIQIQFQSVLCRYFAVRIFFPQKLNPFPSHWICPQTNPVALLLLMMLYGKDTQFS